MRLTTSVIIAAALIGTPALAQAPGANNTMDAGNAVNVGAPDAGTATAPTNGLTAGPGTATTTTDPGLAATTAPAGAEPGTATGGRARGRDADFPWGLLGLLGLAGLLGRARRDRSNTDVDQR